MAAHRVPYAATASVAYPKDLMEKVDKAKEIRGCKILHVMAPCPTGWGYDPALTVKVGKMAVELGLWYLAEYENEKIKLNYMPKELKPVDDYLKIQKRFRHLNPEDYQEINEIRNNEWDRFIKKFGLQIQNPAS